MKVRPYSYFGGVDISEVPECHFVMADEISVRVTKITLRIGVS